MTHSFVNFDGWWYKNCFIYDRQMVGFFILKIRKQLDLMYLGLKIKLFLIAYLDFDHHVVQ